MCCTSIKIIKTCDPGSENLEPSQNGNNGMLNAHGWGSFRGFVGCLETPFGLDYTQTMELAYC